MFWKCCKEAYLLMVKEIVEIIDTLIQWIVFCFCDSNTTCLLKVLEFVLEFLRL